MVQAYQRQLLLEKIMTENDKTAQLLSQRQTIQEQRKAANMAASMHRNKVNQLMDSMKNVHNLEKLAPGGWTGLSRPAFGMGHAVAWFESGPVCCLELYGPACCSNKSSWRLPGCQDGASCRTVVVAFLLQSVHSNACQCHH